MKKNKLIKKENIKNIIIELRLKRTKISQISNSPNILTKISKLHYNNLLIYHKNFKKSKKRIIRKFNEIKDFKKT